MLYLLRSYFKDGKSVLKVGFTNNYSYRFSQYYSHNPGIEEVKNKEGDVVDETLLHLYLHSLGYGELGDEWYKDCQEVIDIFQSRNYYRNIWEKRDEIFSKKFSKGLFDAYTYLLNHFGTKDDINKFLPIDSLYKNAKREVYRNELLQKLNSKESICDDLYTDDLLLKFYTPINYVERLKVLENMSWESIKKINSFLPISCLGCSEDNYKGILGYVRTIEEIPYFHNKMKYIYELDLPVEFMKLVLDNLSDTIFSKYYWSISRARASALKYQKGNLEAEYNNSPSLPSIPKDPSELIQKSFIPGHKYSKSTIKSTLKNIYDECFLDRSAKASDLDEFFDIKECQVTNKETGKRDKAYEIIRWKK